MENKINIAKLLKDCPKGMELDCASYDNVSFDKISDDKKATYPIFCYITDKEGNRSGISFTENGCESKRYGAKCVIFPKGKTTWEGFVPPCEFKDGDIISDSFGSCIFKGEGRIKGTVDYYCGTLAQYFHVKDSKQNHNAHYGNIVDYRLATEEEKAKLFQTIKDNGYKWNPETKTLEKLIEPKFKVGDKIRLKNDNDNLFYKIINIKNDYYVTDKGELSFPDEHLWELVPNKFDITTLVPFESKVLVRAVDNQFWRPAIWGVKHCDWDFCCVLGGEMWEQCIPYEGNEHLLGTTDDCDKYFKIWES